jgi:hypothetical protein
LISLFSHPSTLEITNVIITTQKTQNCTQYRDSNNSKGNDGKTEKRGKPLPPPIINQYKNQKEMKKTDTPIQDPTKPR